MRHWKDKQYLYNEHAHQLVQKIYNLYSEKPITSDKTKANNRFNERYTIFRDMALKQSDENITFSMSAEKGPEIHNHFCLIEQKIEMLKEVSIERCSEISKRKRLIHALVWLLLKFESHPKYRKTVEVPKPPADMNASKPKAAFIPVNTPISKTKHPPQENVPKTAPTPEVSPSEKVNLENNTVGSDAPASSKPKIPSPSQNTGGFSSDKTKKSTNTPQSPLPSPPRDAASPPDASLETPKPPLNEKPPAGKINWLKGGAISALVAGAFVGLWALFKPKKEEEDTLYKSE
jgi:hypothetical protein